MREAAAKKNTPFHHLTAAVKAKAITPAIPQTKNIQQKRHATHYIRTSVDSTRETQSWVHQPGELHAHLAVDFLHLSLLFNGENATQKK